MKKSQENLMTNFSLLVNPRILKEVKALAEVEGRTASDLIREGIVSLLFERKKKQKELKK